MTPANWTSKDIIQLVTAILALAGVYTSMSVQITRLEERMKSQTELYERHEADFKSKFDTVIRKIEKLESKL